MGNAVGPVTLIAAGIYLGYLTLTGRAANFVAFVKSGGQSTAAGSSSSGAGAANNGGSGSPGDSATYVAPLFQGVLQAPTQTDKALAEALRRLQSTTNYDPAPSGA